MKKLLEKNAVIYERHSIADGVELRMLVEEFVYRIQMVLVIDENTNFEAVRKNRKNILLFLQELNKVQGSDLNDNHKNNLYGLIKWNDDGMGWAMIAPVLNLLALSLTVLAYAESREKENQHLQLGENQKFISNPRFLAGIGGHLLATNFLALGKALPDFNEWMQDAFEDIEKNRWTRNIYSEPFTGEEIRQKARDMKAKIKSGKIIISSEDARVNILEFKIYLTDHKRCIAKAIELLDEQDLHWWRQNKVKLLSKIDEIRRAWDSSQDLMIIGRRENIKNPGKI